MSAVALPPASASGRTAARGTRPPRTGQGSGTPDPVRAYAQAVVRGKVVVGSLVCQACQRHLDDLRTGKERRLTWHLDEALRVIDLIGRFRLPSGEPFVLQPAQQFIVASLFGWYEGPARRFRTASIEMGKGNGKPDRERSTEKIDGVAAWCDALFAWANAEPEEECHSVYDGLTAEQIADRVHIRW